MLGTQNVLGLAAARALAVGGSSMVMVWVTGKVGQYELLWGKFIVTVYVPGCKNITCRVLVFTRPVLDVQFVPPLELGFICQEAIKLSIQEPVVGFT